MGLSPFGGGRGQSRVFGQAILEWLSFWAKNGTVPGRPVNGYVQARKAPLPWVGRAHRGDDYNRGLSATAGHSAGKWPALSTLQRRAGPAEPAGCAAFCCRRPTDLRGPAPRVAAATRSFFSTPGVLFRELPSRTRNSGRRPARLKSDRADVCLMLAATRVAPACGQPPGTRKATVRQPGIRFAKIPCQPRRVEPKTTTRRQTAMTDNSGQADKWRHFDAKHDSLAFQYGPCSQQFDISIRNAVERPAAINGLDPADSGPVASHPLPTEGMVSWSSSVRFRACTASRSGRGWAACAWAEKDSIEWSRTEEMAYLFAQTGKKD